MSKVNEGTDIGDSPETFGRFRTFRDDPQVWSKAVQARRDRSGFKSGVPEGEGHNAGRGTVEYWNRERERVLFTQEGTQKRTTEDKSRVRGRKDG